MRDRFFIQKSECKPSHWVCTDILNGIVCVFEDKKFNETQAFTILEDIEQPNAAKLAKAANEMGLWLREHHYKKVLP